MATTTKKSTANITSNVRRFDSLGPRLNKAEVFSVDTDNDTIGVLILTVNIKGNLSY
jgi:hypothetical protein